MRRIINVHSNEDSVVMDFLPAAGLLEKPLWSLGGIVI